MPPMTSVPQARADTGEAGCCRSVCAIAYRSPFSDLLRTLHPLLSAKIYFSALAPFSTPDIPSHQQGPTHHCHYRCSRAADPLLRLMRPSRSSWWHLPLRSPGGSLYNSQVGKESKAKHPEYTHTQATVAAGRGEIVAREILRRCSRKKSG